MGFSTTETEKRGALVARAPSWLTSGLSGIEGGAAPGALALAALALLWLLHFLSGLGLDALDPARRAIQLAIYFGAATLIAWRVRYEPRERLAWAAFAVALTLGGIGWLVYWAAYADAARVPYPSLADGIWFVVYAADLFAVATLRERRDIYPRNVGLALEAAAVFLIVWGLATAFALPLLTRTIDASQAAIVTDFVYVVGDLTVLTAIATAFLFTGGRPGAVWGLLALAYSARAVADVFWLAETTHGTWQGGGVVDSAWTLRPLLIAAAALLPAMPRVAIRTPPRARIAIPAVLVLVGAGLAGVTVVAQLPRGAALLALLATLAASASLALAVRELSLSELARRGLPTKAGPLDALTGLPPHARFQQRLAELERNPRRTFAVLLCDVVGLGAINAELGHEEGDRYLRMIGDALRRAAGIDGEAFRTGGDQFAVLVPDARAWHALLIAERISEATAARTGTRGAALSIGVAERTHGLRSDQLLKRARSALESARATRRGVVVWGPGIERETSAKEGYGADTAALSTALARAVDAKDSYTRSHCETVSALCVLIASELGLSAERIAKLRTAGLLHDVGKIGIPDAILHKPGPLTDDEYEVMKCHTTIGHMIVSGAGLAEEADWVLHHHERVDGRGYPDGLSGEAIPLEARIIFVADAFEAMTSDRPYRPGRPAALALEELRRHAGTQFDEACVEALAAVIERGSLPAAA